MARTRASDQTDVGQGLALGCLAVGVTAVTANKQALEFAFRRAWQDWPHRQKFRFIHASAERNDILHIVRKSERRRGAILAAWELGRWAEPYLREDHDLDEAAQMLPAWTGVPWDGWVQLGRLFTAQFKDAELRRE